MQTGNQCYGQQEEHEKKCTVDSFLFQEYAGIKEAFILSCKRNGTTDELSSGFEEMADLWYMLTKRHSVRMC
jgi:hypothetical protein